MKKSLISIRGAAIMGLAWATAWVPVGALVGTVIVGELEPEWMGGPLYAGFVCGAIFSAVAGVARAGRGFRDMSLFQSGMRGAVSGLLAGGLWVAVALLSDPPRWWLNGAVVGCLTILSATSGVGSALLARLATNDASAHAA